jgi:hypothetical protein
MDHPLISCEHTSLQKSGLSLWRLQTVYKTTVRISLSPFAPRKLVGVTAVSRDLTSQCSRPHFYTNSRRDDEFLFQRCNMLGCHTTTTSHQSDIPLLAPLLRKLRTVLVRTEILPHGLGTIRCFQGPVRVDYCETIGIRPQQTLAGDELFSSWTFLNRLQGQRYGFWFAAVEENSEYFIVVCRRKVTRVRR